MTLRRRQLLGGTQRHIASLLVQCLPQQSGAVADGIAAMPSAEVPLREDGGKMVVLLEVTSEEALMECVHDIQAMRGVICANLAYHQFEEEGI